MSDDEDAARDRPGSAVDAGDDGGSTGLGEGSGTDGRARDDENTDGTIQDDEDTDRTVQDDVGDEAVEHAPDDAAPADVRSEGDGPTAHTTERRSLSSGVQLLWGIGMIVPVVVLTLAATFIAATFDAVPSWAGAAVGFVLLLVGVAWVHARYRVWVYEVRDDSLYLERGVFTHVRTIAPYVRIQHVDTQRGPLERWLGLSTLVVYTAGTRGADVSIPGLTRAEARDLQERVKELAIRAEGGDAV